MKFIFSFLLYIVFLSPVFATITEDCSPYNTNENICSGQPGCYWDDFDDTTPCQECPAGFGCINGNQTQCNNQLGAHQVHPLGASSCTDFICESGWRKTADGNGCELNCTNIPDNAYIPAGEENCNNWMCNQGYYKNGNTCVECPSGSTTSGDGATNINQCSCKGSSQPIYIDGVWEYCFVTQNNNTGSYDSTTHSFDCIQNANRTETGPNSDGIYTINCTCPEYSSIENNECKCDTSNNYRMAQNNNGIYYCSQCDTNATATGTTCKCNSDYYGDGTPGNCTHCPANSTTNGATGKQNVTDCKCGKGYYDTPTATIPVNCAICPAGSTTTGIGATAISECKMTSNTLFCDGNGNNCLNLLPSGITISASAN